MENKLFYLVIMQQLSNILQMKKHVNWFLFGIIFTVSLLPAAAFQNTDAILKEFQDESIPVEDVYNKKFESIDVSDNFTKVVNFVLSRKDSEYPQRVSPIGGLSFQCGAGLAGRRHPHDRRYL